MPPVARRDADLLVGAAQLPGVQCAAAADRPVDLAHEVHVDRAEVVDDPLRSIAKVFQ